MAVKYRPYGRHRITPPPPWTALIKVDGSSSTSAPGVQYPDYYRRFGSESKISSQSGRDGRFRPCTHRTANYSVRPISGMPQYLSAGTTYTSPSLVRMTYSYNIMQDCHANRYERFTAACDQVSSPIGTVQWNTLAAQALSTMLPSLGGDNSWLNFLLELKDFRQLLKYIDGNIVRKLGVLRKLTGIRTGDKPMQKLSKTYLSYQFGWKPLYRDIVSFVQTYSTLYERIRELVQRANSPQQRYWGTWVSGTSLNKSTFYTKEDGPRSGASGPGGLAACFRVIQRESQGVRFHATLRYRYSISDDLTSVAGALKVHLDLLGVGLNPAILWNAIPFSFIVDWLVNVNAYLDRLRVDNVHFKTEILDFCTSAKFEREVYAEMASIQTTAYPGAQLYRTPWEVTDHCRVAYYERKLGLPNYLTAIQASGLNMREFTLAGALANATSRRR